MKPDFALIMYISITVISIYGFFLFIWGWIKEKHASHVYSYLTFLFFGLSLHYGSNIYTRTLTLQSDMSYLYEWWWPWRSLIVLIFTFLIVIHMTVRAVSAKRKIGNYEIVKKVLKEIKEKEGK